MWVLVLVVSCVGGECCGEIMTGGELSVFELDREELGCHTDKVCLAVSRCCYAVAVYCGSFEFVSTLCSAALANMVWLLPLVLIQ